MLLTANNPELFSAQEDLRKRTINNHVDELVAAGHLVKKPAGQAFVYYLADRETRSRQHTYTRCGWAIYRDTAYATIELTEYHERPHDSTGPPAQFVLCRVCQNDVVNAIMGNDQNIGDYLTFTPGTSQPTNSRNSATTTPSRLSRKQHPSTASNYSC